MSDTTEKYYTPSLEEFHVGFEYEFIPIDPSTGKPREDWKKKTVHTGSSIARISSQIERGLIRVKRLDHSDIVSAGWVLKNDFAAVKCYEKGDVWTMGGAYLDFHLDGRLKITSVDEGFNRDGPNLSVKIFGTIRNASELKQVMKMIGI